MKSFYEEIQSVKGSKLFSSYRTVFKLIAQSKVFMIPQSISDLNWSWFIPHKMVKNFWGLGMTHLRIWQKFAQLMHKIIRKISAEYYVRIRRNCSSNVRLETPKLGVQSKFIWFLEIYISESPNPRRLVFYRPKLVEVWKAKFIISR